MAGRAPGAMPRRPRILVTGFSVYPGAPVNPTERLIAALDADPGELAVLGDLRFAVFAVEYDTLPGRLEETGSAFAPDIAIHFGLSERAEGFTLERLARNAISAEKPDNAGRTPPRTPIRAGGEDLASSLPLDAVHAALSARGLPVSWSDDAGGYLCNYLFYHSRGRLCAGFAPAMSGFIHVPPLLHGETWPANAMTMDNLVAGARLIIATCAKAWGA